MKMVQVFIEGQIQGLEDVLDSIIQDQKVIELLDEGGKDVLTTASELQDLVREIAMGNLEQGLLPDT